jgi:hypothetical protein
MGGSKRSHPRRHLTQWCALIITKDCIRQTISSSPVSLSKRFVAPTTSAPALVLRMSMRARTFMIFLEQRGFIRFLILKSLHASAIAHELKWVCETEALALSTVKKWRKCFAEGRTSLYDNPMCGRHFLCVEGEAVPFMQGSLSAFPHCKRDLFANSS